MVCLGHVHLDLVCNYVCGPFQFRHVLVGAAVSPRHFDFILPPLFCEPAWRSHSEGIKSEFVAGWPKGFLEGLVDLVSGRRIGRLFLPETKIIPSFPCSGQNSTTQLVFPLCGGSLLPLVTNRRHTARKLSKVVGFCPTRAKHEMIFVSGEAGRPSHPGCYRGL